MFSDIANNSGVHGFIKRNWRPVLNSSKDQTRLVNEFLLDSSLKLITASETQRILVWKVPGGELRDVRH